MAPKLKSDTRKFDNTVCDTVISRIEFRILTEEEISKLSVVDITSKTLHDIKTRQPSPNGPLDLKLGTSTSANICSTCHGDIQNCPGHWGRIKLVVPVFHIGFLSHTVNLLNMICKSCSKCLLPLEKRLIYHDVTKFKTKIKDNCKLIKICSFCNSQNGIVKKINFRIYHEIKPITSKNETTTTSVFEELSPYIVYSLFENIPIEDMKYLFLKQSPVNLLIKQLAVPPSCIRPSVDLAEKGFNEDDITVKLSEIVNVNTIIEQGIRGGMALNTMNDDWDFLQLQISLLFNSDLPTVSNIGTNATPIKGYIQRLKGKFGRFRMHLSGKRVDFSGRTVISPDPNLSIDQIGVPKEIAKEMTFPEKVTDFNIDFMRKLIENGPDNYPGANYILYPDGKKIFLKYARKKKVSVGDIVERHLLDNDILLFNRQPSLHRISIMAHRVKIHNNQTFRFNVCDCTPYNADFDGDEMNIHFPQNYEAKAEAEILMGISNNICTPRNNEPLVSPTQDFITGSFILTSKDRFFTKKKFFQLLCYIQSSTELIGRIDIKPAIIAPVELYTGKQLIEVIVQVCSSKYNKTITLKCKNRAPTPKYNTGASEPREFYMLKNHYIYGVLDKSVIGSDNRKGSLIYQMMKISNKAVVQLMNSIAKLSVRFLMERGFSIGLDDVYLTENVTEGKNEIVSENVNEVFKILDSNKEYSDTDELKISSYLNKIRELCGTTCIANLSTKNAPIVMQECGSKGSKINVSQMIACVGQQIISGKRISDGMIDRTLPHFNKYDNSPSARGFVFNSFFTGLTSYEYFFHTVSGREGLVDTAVKTAETGYMQRRLMKALEDLSVYYDSTVRNSHKNIIQFVYGEDGLNPLFYESEMYENIFNSVREYNCDEKFEKNFFKFYLESLIEELGNEKLKTDVKEYLETKYTNDHVCKQVLVNYFNELKKYLKNISIEPGTAVGAISAQSIGEPGTQMTLKTFHFAGVASMNITLGVPRLKEIINANTKIATPIINIVGIQSESEAVDIRKRIEKVFIKDVCKSIEAQIQPSGCIKLIFQVVGDINSIISVVCRKFNVKQDSFDSFCHFIDNPNENSIFTVEKIKRQILDIQISGYKNINNVFIKKESDSYSLIVEGIDFFEVLGTRGVNPYTTVTNSILSIADVLGIEAARNAIINEIEYTMGSHGIKIDQRHLMLLADTMTNNGSVLGITRYGIGKMKESTLMLASFEKTADIIFNAAYECKKDPISGTSESIILGKKVGLGTGCMEILE
ncbi:RPC1 [Hepatospora eriocheir]|uniref:DNA-directed RNA polymerase subunit n=1 Tax=Hepatospora eriocheir TaxID=1081669 RepID=A0A1X0QEE8_9MICR|nr:RPC1 [Hepatospora eriocheir]